MNSILPVTAGWAMASGPRDKRIYFKLRAELLPENADLIDGLVRLDRLASGRDTRDSTLARSPKKIDLFLSKKGTV